MSQSKLKQRVADSLSFLKSQKYQSPTYLGSGSYGDVFKAVNDKKQPVAIKIVKVAADNLGSLLRELSIQYDIAQSSPYLVPLSRFEYNKQMEKVLIEMPLAVGDLAKGLGELVSFSPYQLFVFVYRLFCGLHGLHAAGLTHFDIKPNNILMFNERKTFIPKLSDFGLSVFLESANQFQPNNRITQTYRPPEMLKGNPGDEKADIWSMGIVLIEILFVYLTEGVFPWEAFEHKYPDVQSIISEHLSTLSGLDLFNFPFRVDTSEIVTEEDLNKLKEKYDEDQFHYFMFLMNLVPHLLKTKSSERPSALQVLEWMKEEEHNHKEEQDSVLICPVSLIKRDKFTFNTEGNCVIDRKEKEEAIDFIEQSLCEKMGIQYDPKNQSMKKAFRELAKVIYSSYSFTREDFKDPDFVKNLVDVLEKILTSDKPLLPLYESLEDESE